MQDNATGPTLDRRRFLEQGALGLSAALTGVSALRAGDQPGERPSVSWPVGPPHPHFPPRAKRLLFLFMVGGPSQPDLFDYKPKLQKLDGQDIPESFLKKMQFAQIQEKQPKLLGTRYRFARHGQSGAELSELLPHLARVVDDLAILKTVQATEVPHHPAEVFLHTGTRVFGRPSLGAWLTYGVGSESDVLPGYVVLQSGMRPRTKGNIYASGFLSSAYQGVPLRETGEPILNLNSPAGVTAAGQQRLVRAVTRLNDLRQQTTADPETAARSAAYRLALRLQQSAPEAVDLGRETAATLKLYGADQPDGAYARNCLLARRMLERGVRCVQLTHGDWDHHGDLEQRLPVLCRQTDQATAALLIDLKQRGLLEDTLVLWGGELGRTAVGQVNPQGAVGRDHQIAAYTMWLAGGGIRPGMTLGETDDLGCFPVSRPISIHDLYATMLHLLGLDHEQLTYRFQGRNFRLTDVAGNVVDEILA
ncbi:MAG: DUF1501 domain-containing protein [Planctomycetales bacterium]